MDALTGKTKQDYGTPPELLLAVRQRFGPIVWDLAARRDNAVTGWWYGPGSGYGVDSLAEDWDATPSSYCGSHGVLWCNPPFKRAAPWVAKAAAYRGPGTICMLVLASVGSTWFAEYVHDKALVLALRPRVTFVGESQGFNKDLMLCVYGPQITPGFDLWQWRQSARVLASSMPRSGAL